jgi:hypothetical protein
MTRSDPTRESARRSPPITCPKYLPMPGGGRRCQHFESNGGCRLPDEFMCVEWLKANGEPIPAAPRPLAAPPTPSVESGSHPPAKAFLAPAGAPVVAITPTARTFALTPSPSPVPQRVSTPASTTRPAIQLPRAPSAQHAPSAADITAFKARGIEVHVATDTLGEIAIVPVYTDADRLELSIEHAALIASVCTAFPGARVTAIRKAAGVR